MKLLRGLAWTFCLEAMVATALLGCAERAATARCVPGMAATCICRDGRAGAQACTSEGTFAACACDGCAEGQAYRCACRDGRAGLATCEGGVVQTCACFDPLPEPCLAGARRACECADASEGSQRCEADGRFGACVCGMSCESGSAVACACADGRSSVARCEGSSWGVCLCPEPDAAVDIPNDDAGADAPVAPPIDAGLPPEPSCPACGCETIEPTIAPGPRRTLHAGAEYPQWFVTEEGYVGVRAGDVILLDREGVVRATHVAPARRYYVGASATERSLVVWTHTEIEVLSPALELVRTIALRSPCRLGVVLPCRRLVCVDRTTVTYDLSTGAWTLGASSIEPDGFDLWSAERGHAVPDRDAFIRNTWPDSTYVRWVDGSLRVTAVFPSTVVAVGPGLAITVSGEIRSLEGCGEEGSTGCFALVGSVGHDLARAAWGDGSFYVVRGFVLERLEVDTGALSTLEVGFPGSQLLYDPWSRSVIGVDYATVGVVPVP